MSTDELEKAINNSSLTENTRILLHNAITDIENKINNEDSDDEDSDVIEKDELKQGRINARVERILKALEISREENGAKVKKDNLKDVNGLAMQKYVRTVIDILTSAPFYDCNIKDHCYFPILISDLDPKDTDKYHYSSECLYNAIINSISTLKDFNKETISSKKKVQVLKEIGKEDVSPIYEGYQPMELVKFGYLAKALLEKDNLNGDLIFQIGSVGSVSDDSRTEKDILHNKVCLLINKTFNTYLREIGLIDKKCQLTKYGTEFLHNVTPQLMHNYFKHQYFDYHPATSYTHILYPLIKTLKWINQDGYKYFAKYTGILLAYHLLTLRSYNLVNAIKVCKGHNLCLDCNTAYMLLLSLFTCFIASTRIKPSPAVAKVMERIKYINQVISNNYSYFFDD